MKVRWFSQRENWKRPDRIRQGIRGQRRNTPSERGRFLLLRWSGCFACPYSTPLCDRLDGTFLKWHHLKQFGFCLCQRAWNIGWCAWRSSVNNRLKFWTNPSQEKIQQRESRKRKITRFRYSKKVRSDLNRVVWGSLKWNRFVDFLSIEQIRPYGGERVTVSQLDFPAAQKKDPFRGRVVYPNLTGTLICPRTGRISFANASKSRTGSRARANPSRG